MEPTLTELRAGIDDCDRAWLGVLGARFALTKQVGTLKAQNALPAIDLVREQMQFEQIGALAVAHDVPVELAQNILRLIIDSVVQQHEAVKSGIEVGCS